MSALLEVRGLSVAFGDRRVVDRLDFVLAPGEALGIVGESGSGKSQAALAILGLSPASAHVDGSIVFDGHELIGLRQRQLNRLRGREIGAVFQNPVASLNPHLRIGLQLSEMLEVHRGMGRAAALAESARLLDAVRVSDPARRLRQFPHELSGGLCQRVAIAMALSCGPRLLVADEPTTALDATTQAQLLDLLLRLRRELRLALLLISHDLAVVGELCEQVLVMQAGRVTEHGATAQVLQAPQQAYTATLVHASAQLRAR